jgi:hydrogenase-4 component H
MRYPKLRELKEAIRALIKGPYTSKFPYKPHTPFERFRGRTEYHQDDCMGCAACVQVCPTGALEFKDTIREGKAARTLTVRWDVCIFCGNCQANCPTSKGIMLSQKFDLATTEKRQDLIQAIDKELLLCDCCSEIIAPYDQIMWVARRLGPLCFSNASLILFYLRHLDLALPDMPPEKEKEGLRRPDRVRILCPRCRRETVLKS